MRRSLAGRLRWLWHALPFALAWDRLRELGVFSGGQVGVIGSDFYSGATIGRLLLKYPWGIPETVTEFDFPTGVAKAALPEFFSEPLLRGVLFPFVALAGDPVTGMWAGVAGTNLLNIAFCWILFWRRFAARSAAAAAAGFALLCWNPWTFARSTSHWHLSWIPPLLWVTLLWWDHFTGRRRASAWVFALAHALLLSQSVYYGFFAILLVGFWALYVGLRACARRTLLPGAQALLPLALAAGLGYAVSAAWSAHGMGGPSAIARASSVTERPLLDLHIFSSRMRNLIRGGPHSPWAAFAEAYLGKSPAKQATDGENFYAPLPKLALLALTVALAIAAWRARTRRRLAYLGLFCAAFWGFHLVGLQETPWFKNQVLHKIAPFIRSYARIMMPVLCVSALWVSRALASYLPRLSLRTRTAAASAFFLLLWADYGWPQPASQLAAELGCSEVFEVLRRNGDPVLMNHVEFRKGACPGVRELDVYAITGQPFIGRPWGSPAYPLRPGESACLIWHDRAFRAGRSAKGFVTAWLEGPPEDIASGLHCLTTGGTGRAADLKRVETLLRKRVEAVPYRELAVVRISF